MIKTLNDILNIMGDRFVSVCKELSKINESNYYGKVSQVILDFDKMTKVKGEYVIVVAKEGYDE